MSNTTLSNQIDARVMLGVINTALPKLENLSMILLSRPAGWAVAAMLCNKLAKQAQYVDLNMPLAMQLYGFKSHLLNGALLGGVTHWAAPHAHGDYGQVMIAVEDIPAIGQLCFHVAADDYALEQAIKAAPAANGRVWDGIPKQEMFLSYVVAYLRSQGVLYVGTIA